MTPLMRRMQDLALRINSNLTSTTCTLYRYKVARTDYHDLTKVLIDVSYNVPCYIDFPGQVDTGERTQIYIEDLLPITALFPWKVGSQALSVDINDEFEIPFTDELGTTTIYRYQINNKSSFYSEFHLYREFIVSPFRVDQYDINQKPIGTGFIYRTGTGGGIGGTGAVANSWEYGVFTGAILNPNIEIGKASKDLNSLYDEYNNAF